MNISDFLRRVGREQYANRATMAPVFYSTGFTAALRGLAGMSRSMLFSALSVLVLVTSAAQADQSTSPTQNGLFDSTIDEFTKAADLSDPETQLTIRLMCGKGVNPPPGYIGSLQWYRKAADQGSAQAQYYLGGMYETGRRVLRDYVRAAQWYHQAARQGHVKAQVTLGYMYESGRGVPQDYQRAITWYRKAADQGFAMAQFNIGTLYESGHGVAKDEDAAEQWYRKAAEQGYEKALNRLAEMGDSAGPVEHKIGQPASTPEKIVN